MKTPFHPDFMLLTRLRTICETHLTISSRTSGTLLLCITITKGLRNSFWKL
uniref:Uncharacterized protein n=1 Tax=Arundo donax TaxID=35708 RepID=A0A0A9ECC8_ARUDO